MNLLKNKILQLFPDWNQRILTDIDMQTYCTAREIITFDTHLIDDPGEYRVKGSHPFILIHKYLDDRYRSWVFAHEVAHDILHTPACCRFSTQTVRRIEKEANIFAAVALIPRYLLETRHITEIIEELGYPRKLILLRKWIYDTFKI